MTLLLAACTVTGAILIGLAVVRCRYIVVQVVGRSMLPGLRPGDRVLVRRGATGHLRVGAIAVAGGRTDQHSQPAAGRRWVIKRVAAVPGDAVPSSARPATGGASVVPEGKVILLSDNPAGTDSRRWGFIPVSDLLGQVIARLPPSG